MFFAQRTRQRLKLILLGAAVYALIVLVLALVAPAPNVPFSVAYGRWLLGIPAALIVWAALELIGTWVLERQFWNRMPSWARVVLLASLVSVVAVLAVWLGVLWQASSAA